MHTRAGMQAGGEAREAEVAGRGMHCQHTAPPQQAKRVTLHPACSGRRVVQGAQLRHWRWRGILTDYLEAAPPAGAPARPGAPAILLVHGFGAFSGEGAGSVVR